MDGITYKQVSKDKNKYVYEVKLDPEVYNHESAHIFGHLSAKVKIPGFRPGKAPKEKVEKYIASDVFNETINHILPESAVEVITKESINPISRVNYDVKDIASDMAVTFEMTFYATPDVDLKKFEKITIKTEKEEVSDKEIADVIRNIIRTSLPNEKWDKRETKPTDENYDPKDPNSYENTFEITDEIISELGYEDEKTYEGMKKRVRETLEGIKSEQYDRDLADEVLKEAISIADFFIPEDTLNDSLARRESVFMDRVEKLKLNLDDYLKTLGKSMEQMKEEWKKEIEIEIGADILGVAVAMKEELIPTEEEIDKEIEKVEDKRSKDEYKRNKGNIRTVMARDKGLAKVIEVVKNK